MCGRSFSRFVPYEPEQNVTPLCGLVDHLHHPLNVALVDDDPRQTEDAPGRIVRVNRHVDIIAVADRHNRFQENPQILKQLFFIDAAVQPQTAP